MSDSQLTTPKKYRIYTSEGRWITTIFVDRESENKLREAGWLLEEAIPDSEMHPLWSDIYYLLQNYVDIPEGIDARMDQLRITARNL